MGSPPLLPGATQFTVKELAVTSVTITSVAESGGLGGSDEEEGIVWIIMGYE